MYRYWVVRAKVPVNKVIPVSKYLSRLKLFGGSRVESNDFPRGLATIYLRIFETGHSNAADTVADELPPLLKSNIEMYHTSEDEDTWMPAHLPRNLEGQKSNLPKSLRTLSKNGVLILGKDSGEYLVELLRIKSLLVGKGYKNAKLLKLIEDNPNQSLTQKLRVWGLMCRFSIIVDRKAAGHLSEFEMLKSQDSIIAVLCPRGFKSTFMMDSHPKSHLIKTFEFTVTPLDVIDKVIEWAERTTKYTENQLNKKYVWRKVNCNVVKFHESPKRGVSGKIIKTQEIILE